MNARPGHPAQRLLRDIIRRYSGTVNHLIVRSASRKWGALATRLPGMSLDELRVRALQALRVRMERVSDRFTFGASSEARPPGMHSGLVGGLEFLTDAGSDPALIARAVARLDPQVRASFSRQSDDAEQGLLALMGNEPLCVGSPPRWHREARSGTEVPRRHWSRIDHLPIPAPSAPGDVQAITHAGEQSGRMIVLANSRGRWQRLGVVEPRRG